MTSLPIVLAQRSSLELFDLHHELLAGHEAWHPTPSPTGVLASYGFEAASLERIEALGLPEPVEVLVPRSGGMRHPPGIRPCSHARPLFLEDLIPIAEGIYTCTPELALTECLPHMSVPRAATVIDQVVSSYRIVRPEAGDAYLAAHPSRHVHALTARSGCGSGTMTMYGLAPLTTLGQLEEFSLARSYISGIDRLRNALPLCVERLRSPLEAEDLMLCCCPRRLGGLGLPRPQVNEPLALTAKSRHTIDCPTLTPDFCWPQSHVIVEVLGRRDHEGSDVRIADTSMRERVWREMGFAPLTHTAREIERPSLFEPLGRELARRLGVRYRTDVELFAVRQGWLRSEVAPPLDGMRTPSLRSWREMLADERYEEWEL